MYGFHIKIISDRAAGVFHKAEYFHFQTLKYRFILALRKNELVFCEALLKSFKIK